MIKIILLIDLAEEFAKEVLKGIMRYSQKHGPWSFCRMPLTYLEQKGVDGVLKWAKEWGADGIIGKFKFESRPEMFLEEGIAVISQDFKGLHQYVPNITGNYQKAGCMGAEYFLARGYNNFAFYGFENIIYSRERAKAFERRLGKEGYNVYHYQHKRKNEPGEMWFYMPSALGQWLKSLPKPIALMAANDNLALHITEACQLAGIRVPEEMAVLGVDNDETICNISAPPLSSIVQGAEKTGYEAAELLHKMIEVDLGEYHDIVVQPTQIITRNSTDIYATSDRLIGTALKYIHNNVEKNLKVEDVLKQVPLSRRSLEKRFHKVTGYPVYEYIFNLRIERFTKKLLETDDSIFEIAMDLGLNDSKNISRQFRQVMGCTPTEYRRKHLVNKKE